MRFAQSQDVWGGLLLLLLAAIAYHQAWDLAVTVGRGLGPGAIPKAAVLALAGFGLFLLVRGLVTPPAGLGYFSLRGTIFVIAAIVLFAMSVKALGLVLTGFLTALLSSLAATDFRWLESVVFSAVITAFCAVLFIVLLRLPFPLWPYFWS